MNTQTIAHGASQSVPFSPTHPMRVETARPEVTSVEYARLIPPIPAGIAAGTDVLFVGSPLDGRVLVLSRVTREQIAELPQPPEHFKLPLVLRSIGPSRVAVLDCGGFPSPGVTDMQPALYEYEYSFSNGVFSATLVRTIDFAGTRIGFAEEFVALGAGEYLVPDSVYGAIWRVDAAGRVHPGIVPKSYERADAIAEMVYAPTMPQVRVGGLPFLFTGSTIPGIAGIAERAGVVYFYSSCTGSLYRVPLATLFDAREPWQRAADIVRISTKADHVEVEELLELQFNPYDLNDRYLYAADALGLALIRIDPAHGTRQVLGDDPRLFNFPAALGFLPPEKGVVGSALVVLSNQQHRDPNLNSAVTEDHTQVPYVITHVTVQG